MLEISSPRVHPLLVRAIVYKILHIRASFTPFIYSLTGWMIGYSVGSKRTTLTVQGRLIIIGSLLRYGIH